MGFENLVGNARVVGRLEEALRDGALPHALLLSGPPGAGKTTIALALADELLSGSSWPGGLRAHPDLWLEDSDSERIGIDRVRAGASGDRGPSLQDFLALRPYAGGRRVAVIARADRLTEQAANSLLKALEEPPPLSHLLVCTEQPERLPATVVSRCRSIAVGAVDRAEIRAWLEARHTVSRALAETAALLAVGRPGRALRLATAPGALQAEVDALEAFIRIGGTGAAGALRAAGELAPGPGADGRDRALVQLSVWIGFLRDVACFGEGVPELAAWAGYRPALERWAGALPVWRIVGMLARCLAASGELAAYAFPRLCYEVLFLDIFGSDPAPPGVVELERDPSVATAPRADAAPSAGSGRRSPVSGGGAPRGGRRRR